MKLGTPDESHPSTITLRFTPGENDWQVKPKKMRESISALVQQDECLWVACDETATVERLIANDPAQPTEYSQHTSFRLADFAPLPEHNDGKPDQEVDLEGIDIQRIGADAGYLWLVGSHSFVRKGVKENDTSESGVKALIDVALSPNRCVLLRIPVVRDGGGLPDLRTRTDPRDPVPALTAGIFKDLRAMLTADEHLGPFVGNKDGTANGIPGKDNGLDIEGLAVSENRIFLGLRGPVLRGWALILQLTVDEINSAGELRMKPIEGGRLYRKFFLDLGGLGIRELVADGDDLVLLAGPTMGLDDPVRLHRWRGGATGRGESLVRADQVPEILGHTLRTGPGAVATKDHPEGIAKLTTPNGPRLLVAHDSPAEIRLDGKAAVRIDNLAWPIAPSGGSVNTNEGT